MSEVIIPGVYGAISRVMKGLSETGVGKDGTNTFHKFNYRSIDAVYAALSRELTKNNLMMLPRVISKDFKEGKDKNGNFVSRVSLSVEYDIIYAVDGSKHTICMAGEGNDASDKATTKALSAAFKYAALQSFCIPVDGAGDADGDSVEVGSFASNQPPPSRPRPTAKVNLAPYNVKLGDSELAREVVIMADFLDISAETRGKWLNKANVDAIDRLDRGTLLKLHEHLSNKKGQIHGA